MITSLIEMLELPNLGHRSTSTVQSESRDKILLMTLWILIMMLKSLFQNTFILRESRGANFGDIMKIAIIFIKIIVKDLKNKRFRNYVVKCNLYTNFLI